MARPLILAFFFLSGLTGLLYEVVWIRTAGTVIGNTTYAIGTVVGVFMGGGGARGAWSGGRQSDRRSGASLLRLYGVLELGIAVSALAVPILITASEPVFRVLWNAVGEVTLLYAALRALLVAMLLIVPTTMMGATLPVLSRYLSDSHASAAKEAGRAYAINTFGGVAGVLAAGFFLIPSLGLWTTTVTAPVINVGIGAACLALARAKGGAIQPSLVAMAKPHRLALAVSAVSGFAALVYEVVWTRAVVLAMGSTVYAFTLILTAFILGLAGGSAICSRLLPRLNDSIGALGIIQAAIGIVAIGLLPFLGDLPLTFAALVAKHGQDFDLLLLREFAYILFFISVPALIMGAVFPLACRLSARSDGSIGREVGAVYTWNTLGSVAGSLSASFVLIPLLGLDWTVKLIAVVNLAMAVLLFAKSDLKMKVVYGLPAVGLLLAWAMPSWSTSIMSSGGFVYGKRHIELAQSRGMDLREYANANGQILATYWDSYGLVTVTRYPDGMMNIRVNGKTDASTHEKDVPTQLYTAHLPLLHHPAPRRALVIGLGAGLTVGATEQYPLEEIECIEISTAMAKAAEHFSAFNGDALGDERLKLVIGDGRNAVKFAARPYDIIISEPSNLWLSGMANLFTRDFFLEVQGRLAPGGIFCQWLHASLMSPEDFRTVLRTFGSVFEHASLWEISPGGDYLLLGTPEPLRVDYAEMEARLEALEGDGRLKGWLAPGAQGLMGGLIANGATLSSHVGAGPVLTDDLCDIEYTAPRSMHQNNGPELLRWLDGVRGAEGALGSYAFRSEAAARKVGDRRQARRVAAAAMWKGPGPGIQGILDLLEVLKSLSERYPEDTALSLVLEEASNYVINATLLAIEAKKKTPAVLLGESIPASALRYGEIRSKLGRFLMSIGENAAARASLDKALGVKPEAYEAWVSLALLEVQEGRYEAAIARWKKAIALRPKAALPRLHLGYCYLRTGQGGEALAEARAALSLEPSNLEVHALMERIRAQAGAKGPQESP